MYIAVRSSGGGITIRWIIRAQELPVEVLDLLQLPDLSTKGLDLLGKLLHMREQLGRMRVP